MEIKKSRIASSGVLIRVDCCAICISTNRLYGLYLFPFQRAKLVWLVQSKYHRIILDQTVCLDLRFVCGIVKRIDLEFFVSLRLCGMLFTVTNHDYSSYTFFGHTTKNMRNVRANQFSERS